MSAVSIVLGFASLAVWVLGAVVLVRWSVTRVRVAFRLSRSEVRAARAERRRELERFGIEL